MLKALRATTLDAALALLGGLVAQNEKDGGENFIFCEDRLTLLAERAVLESTGGATFSSEVTTFARFLSSDKKVLSKEGSVVALSAIMQEKKGELSCFSQTQAQAVYETIAQLLSSRVDAALLRQSAERAEGTLSRKLSDLALLLEAYEAFLNEKGFLDENGYLALLPEKIAAGELRNKNVFFFAFPSFTAQAREGVRAAVQNARSVTGIFLDGDEALYTHEGYNAFTSVLKEFGFEPDKDEKAIADVAAAADARAFAEALYCPERRTERKRVTDAVEFFTAEDEEREAETVCALLKKYVREGVRYCDIAVLVEGENFPVWEKAFKRYHIPYYADKKRAFSTHPFCAFALSVLECVSGGGAPDAVDALLSNIYFGNGDEYRNYLLKYGCYRGAYKKAIREDAGKFDRAKLIICRARLEKILKPFVSSATGAEYAKSIRALREIVGEEKTTERLAQAFEGEEKEFLALDPLESVLLEIELVAGARFFTADAFRKLLQNALKAVSVSMIPQRVDAVFLGDCTASKFKRVKVLFATGLTDALPRVTNDTAVIGDGDIKTLHDLSMEIEPAVAVVNKRACESLALNLTAFSQKLYLSYPLKKSDEECAPSEVLYFYKGAFKEKTVKPEFYLSCCDEATAALTLYALKDDYESGRERDQKKYAALYDLLSRRGALKETNDEAYCVGASALYFKKDISPTLLENYFECPYSNFVNRALKMQRREEGAMGSDERGIFVHAVLQFVAANFNKVADCAGCEKMAHDRACELITEPKYAQFSETDEGSYATEQLVAGCVRAARAFYEQITGSNFKVARVESEINYPALGLIGKADRIDESEGLVRVVDYKTGTYDTSAGAYYTGRKLQLELYLLSAAKEKKAAGAFYFPAKDEFSEEREIPYKMSGFFSTDDEVVSCMDKEGNKGVSRYYECAPQSQRGMPQSEFEDFLSYSLFVAQKAKDEMAAGNVAPSPYKDACKRCSALGMCAFTGKPRGESKITCKEIVAIVRAEEGKHE